MGSTSPYGEPLGTQLDKVSYGEFEAGNDSGHVYMKFLRPCMVAIQSENKLRFVSMFELTQREWNFFVVCVYHGTGTL